MKLDCAGKSLDLSRTVFMGILNVTPDSFSDGGSFVKLNAALKHARLMIEDGAQIIDIGGESTRPGAQPVDLQQELDRVIPIIELIHNELDTIISVDTSKAYVMQEAVKAGAGLINDVCALADDESKNIVAQTSIPVCLMHMQGSPRVMQKNPHYNNVVDDVKSFLENRITECKEYGIANEKIIIDPGFGFGKTVAHNIALLKGLNNLKQLDRPILAGLSRKSMIGHLLGLDIEQREAPSMAVEMLAVQNGANIIRTHDVKNTCRAIRMLEALEINHDAN